MATAKQEDSDRFFETIEHGMAILDGELKSLARGGVFNGETASLHVPTASPRPRLGHLPRAIDHRRRQPLSSSPMARQKEQQARRCR